MTTAEDIVKDMRTNAQVHAALDVARSFLDSADRAAAELPDGGGVFGTGIDLRASAKDDIEIARLFVDQIYVNVPDDNAEVAGVHLTAARKAMRITAEVLQLVREVAAKVNGHDLVAEFFDGVAALANMAVDAAGDIADHAVDRLGDTAKKAAKKVTDILGEIWPVFAVAGVAVVAYVGIKVLR